MKLIELDITWVLDRRKAFQELISLIAVKEGNSFCTLVPMFYNRNFSDSELSKKYKA